MRYFKGLRIRLPQTYLYAGCLYFYLFRDASSNCLGFNQFFNSWIKILLKRDVYEASISFSKAYKGFSYESFYYDGQNHIVNLGFISIYWSGDDF